MNDGVIFYKSHFDNIKDLSDEELGQIFRACMTGETGVMSPHVKMAYNFVNSQIKRDKTKYETIVEKRRAAGRKGGLAKGKSSNNQDNEEIANQANANFAKQKQANQANESNNININSNNNINSNINSNIKNDTSIDVSINTATPSVDFLKEKKSWIEMVAMNYGLDIQGVHRWIDKFQLEVIDCKLKTHANNKDLASHFCDWLRIKLAAESAQRKPSDRMKSTNDKLAAYIQTLSS